MYELYKKISNIARLYIKEVRGLDNIPNVPVIFAANHNSYVDPQILFYLLSRIHKVHFYAYKLWWSWLYIKPTECIRLGHATRDGVKMLKIGRNIAIFPEGDRVVSRKLGEFKTGVAAAALLSGAPIVPIGISNSHGLPFFRTIINIGKPMRVRKMNAKIIPRKKLVELTDRVKKRISKLSGKGFITQ